MTKQAAEKWQMHEIQRKTPEDGHTIMTETCRGFLMMLLQNIFNKF
jgi:hypothetical protein